MRALLAGTGEQTTTLVEALAAAGVDAQIVPDGDLAGMLTGVEAELERGGFDGAVAVGTGEAALALAITAAKLGVPLAACPVQAADPDSREGAEQRILGTLAGEHFEPGDQAAERLHAWLEEAA
jgi:hypothetical protein